MGKVLASAIAVLLLLPSIALARVTVSHERFKQQTELFASEAPRTFGVMQMAAGTIIKDGAKTPTLIWVEFRGTQDTWKYLQCHDVHWIVDGKPFDMPKAAHQGQAELGFVIEIIMIGPISQEQLAALADATKVEYEICNDQFVMSREAHDNLGDLIVKIADFARSPTAP